MDNLQSKCCAYCRSCGRPLSHDEIALHKKLYNRAAREYFCIQCSSEYLQVTVHMLEQKIQEFKNMGCTLFDQQP